MSSDENDYESEEVTEEEEEQSEEEEEEEPVKKRRQKKWKDPNKPKRNMSAFFLYSQAYRSQVKEDNPEAKFGDIAKILSKQFKALPERETKKWQSKAEKDKIRYQEDMKHYVAPPEPAGKKKKRKKDPNAPKRNMSAFFLYSCGNRAQVKEENPEAKFGDIAKIISTQFKALNDRERAKWDKKAVEDKERYNREMEEYNSWGICIELSNCMQRRWSVAN